MGSESSSKKGMNSRLVDSLTARIATTFAAGALGAIALAMVGWWAIIEPRIKDYIAENASGPENVIVLSRVDCSEIRGEWVTFAEATGRFVVAAGDDTHTAYDSWSLQRSDGTVESMPLSRYALLDQGGEEKHTLSVSELAEHNCRADCSDWLAQKFAMSGAEEL